jgi:hypothetical protein
MFAETPFWLIAMVSVFLVAVIVTVVGAVVLVRDYLGHGGPPPPPRSDIRHRLAQLPKDRP